LSTDTDNIVTQVTHTSRTHSSASTIPMPYRSCTNP